MVEADNLVQTVRVDGQYPDAARVMYTEATNRYADVCKQGAAASYSAASQLTSMLRRQSHQCLCNGVWSRGQERGLLIRSSNLQL